MTGADNRRPLKDCVVVLLEDGAGQIALQLRDNLPGVGSRDQWGLFGGIIEPGEQPATAAVREIQEELGSILDARRLSFLRAFETETGLRVHLFHYPVADELQHAVLREGQTYRFWTPEQILIGEITCKRVVLQHLAMLRWYWSNRPGSHVPSEK